MLLSPFNNSLSQTYEVEAHQTITVCIPADTWNRDSEASLVFRFPDTISHSLLEFLPIEDSLVVALLASASANLKRVKALTRKPAPTAFSAEQAKAPRRRRLFVPSVD
jgi:hypothetical protein